MPAYSVAHRRGPGLPRDGRGRLYDAHLPSRGYAQRPTDGTNEAPWRVGRLAHPDAIRCLPWPGNFGPLA